MNRDGLPRMPIVCEALERRSLLSAAYLPNPSGPWGYTPPPATLYTPTAKLSSAGSRLLLPEYSTTTLQSRVTSPAYAGIVNKLVDRNNWFIGRYPTMPAAPATSTSTEDPWRIYASELRNTLTLYVSAADVTKKNAYRATLKRWFTGMASWLGEPTAGAPGSGVPRSDLGQSSMIELYAFAHDWLKNDTTFSGTERTQIRNGLIVLTRALHYDQNNGGAAAQWLTAYDANHNHWNYFALGIAAGALWGDTATPLNTNEAKSWMDAAVRNMYYVSQYQNPNGSPTEGFSYGNYDAEPVVLFSYLQKQLINTSVDFLDLPAMRNQAEARLHALLPEAHGTFSYNDDSFSDILTSHWRYHLFAKEFNDPVAQYVGNYVLADIPTSGTAKNRYKAEWESLFFYDPSIVPANVAGHQKYFDDDNLGIYTARSDWNLSSSTSFMGFHAGPFDGWHNVRNYGLSGSPGGHVQPDQGHAVLYQGGKPILPSAGYTNPKLQDNHNTVLFAGRDGQSGSVPQLGGGGQWWSPGIARQSIDVARVLDASHVGGTHAYLADLGGLYRLNDNRDPSGSIRPEYQRRIVYLDNGAMAIVDRIKVSQPRDLKFWLPVYDGTMTLSGNTFNFTTINGVAGKVINYSSVAGQALSVTPYTNTSGAFWRDSIKRQAATISVSGKTEAVFAAVIGINGVVENVTLNADAQGVIMNGTFYAWDKAARGGPSTIGFEAAQGYVTGADVANQSKILGRGLFTSSSNGQNYNVLSVVNENGNNVLRSPAWQSNFANGVNVRHSPVAQELGLSSYDQTQSIAMSFDIRLDDAPGTSGTTAWTLDIGRDGSGPSTGTAATLILQSNGRLQLAYGGGSYTTPAPLPVGAFTRVSFVLNYATDRLSFAIGGNAPVVSNVPFSGTDADQFGYFGLNPAQNQTNYRRISIDNVSIGATNEAPITPTGLNAVAQGAAVALNWFDHADNETGYEVQRATDLNFTTPTVFSRPAGTTAFVDTTAAAGIVYYYRVRALGTLANTPYGDAVSVRLAPAPTAPTAIALAASSDTGVAGDNKTNLNNSAIAKRLSFVVSGTTAGTTVSLYAGTSLIGTAPGTATSTTVLTNGTTPFADGTVSLTATQTSAGVASAASAPLLITVDTLAPKLVSTPVINAATATAARSQVRTITWSFSEPVTANLIAFTLKNRDTGATVVLSGRSVTTNGNTVVLTLDGIAGDAAPQLFLSNANYELFLSPTVPDDSGNALDANGDGVPGETPSLRFFKLLGDFTGDRRVNSTDYLFWSRQYGKTVGPTGADAAFDLNADGRINSTDYLFWSRQYGSSVAALVDGLFYN